MYVASEAFLTGWSTDPRMFWLDTPSMTIFTSRCSRRDSVKYLASSANGSASDALLSIILNIGHWNQIALSLYMFVINHQLILFYFSPRTTLMVDLIIKNLNCKIFRKLCKKVSQTRYFLITVCKLYMFGKKV